MAQLKSHADVMRRAYMAYPSEREFRILEADRNLRGIGGPEIPKSQFILDMALTKIKEMRGSDSEAFLLKHYNTMIPAKSKKKIKAV